MQNLLVYCNVLQALFQNEAKCLLKYHVNPVTTDVVGSNLDQGEVYNTMW
jgi:hypothetical protein